MVHKESAKKFYQIKRTHRKNTESRVKGALQPWTTKKFLKLPNISSNDVYYIRQLTFISFNVHELITGRSVFYTCDETIAKKKGFGGYISMLYHYLTNVMQNEVLNFQTFVTRVADKIRITVF